MVARHFRRRAARISDGSATGSNSDREEREMCLAAVLDISSRFVVSWALGAVNDRHLTLRIRHGAETAMPGSGAAASL